MISLRASFKNQFFEQSAFTTWSKTPWGTLLGRFEPSNGTQGRGLQGGQEPWLSSSWSLRALPEPVGLRDFFPTPFQVCFSLILNRFWSNCWLISNLLSTDYVVKQQTITLSLFAERQPSTYMIDSFWHSSTHNTLDFCNESCHWTVFTCASHQRNRPLIWVTWKVFICEINQRSI